jgi:hypothetical protein
MQRACDKTYQHNLCYSEDRTRLAIIRKEKSSLMSNLFSVDVTFVVDVFDCSSIDFFLRKEPLSDKDPSLLHTIKDP